MSTDEDLRAVQRWAVSAAGLGLALWAAGWVLGQAQDDAVLQSKVFFAYLFAYCFCLSMPLGCLAFWMLHNQTGGAWGQALRRIFEAGARTVPFMALLFVPIALGLTRLYPWADPGQVPEREVRALIEHRAGYMNLVGFLLRAAIYFAAWTTMALLLDRWQAAQDRSWDAQRARRMQVFSGPGLVLYGLAVTFAAIDWLMSLEPEFFSTIFGVLIAVAQALPAYAFAVVAAAWLATRPVPPAEVEPQTWNDIGNLMLALVMLWAYISFAQLLLIWSGNLPEEIVWYLRRSQHGWQYVAMFLALFYFVVPFALLLSRRLKRDPRRLRRIALLIIGVSVVHYFWLVLPADAARAASSETGGPLRLHWFDLAALVGLSGATLAAFVWQLQRRPLTPPYAPAVEEAVQHV